MSGARLVGFAMGMGVLAAALGCTGRVSSERTQTSDTTAAVKQAVKPSGALVYADQVARCRWELPSSDFRIQARHFGPSVDSAKVRHRFTIFPPSGVSLARVDVWDNPQQWKLSEWVHNRLGYLLEDGGKLEPMAVGKAWSDGLIIRNPGSPQAYPRRTVIVAKGEKVVVITGSNVEQGSRRKAFDRIVETMELEVSP